jgi:hypothetical protein
MRKLNQARDVARVLAAHAMREGWQLRFAITGVTASILFVFLLGVRAFLVWMDTPPLMLALSVALLWLDWGTAVIFWILDVEGTSPGVTSRAGAKIRAGAMMRARPRRRRAT